MSIFKRWSSQDVAEWRDQQQKKRSYKVDVLEKLPTGGKEFEICDYGQLAYTPNNGELGSYPLKAFKTQPSSEHKPSVLVTGGVHGYETSGVHGAIKVCEFLLGSEGKVYREAFNFIILPCISPWSYETINRWNPHALDPNRSFFADSDIHRHAEESRLAKAFILDHTNNCLAHFDLHETTDTDNSVFRPALSARDGIEQPLWDIPDGFYLVGDSKRPAENFQSAVIDRVKSVTHIAPRDDNGRIIGASSSQEGVIHFDVKKSGLCIGVTNAPYVTTTEMYPDSPKVNPEECISAQLAAVLGGLDHLLQMPSSDQ